MAAAIGVPGVTGAAATREAGGDTTDRAELHPRIVDDDRHLSAGGTAASGELRQVAASGEVAPEPSLSNSRSR